MLYGLTMVDTGEGGPYRAYIDPYIRSGYSQNTTGDPHTEGSHKCPYTLYLGVSIYPYIPYIWACIILYIY